jgi:hypothetical protein
MLLHNLIYSDYVWKLTDKIQSYGFLLEERNLHEQRARTITLLHEAVTCFCITFSCRGIIRRMVKNVNISKCTCHLSGKANFSMYWMFLRPFLFKISIFHWHKAHNIVKLNGHCVLEEHNLMQTHTIETHFPWTQCKTLVYIPELVFCNVDYKNVI